MRSQVTRRLIERLADASQQPLVMGILNVTPDSFSDGGAYPGVEDAAAHGLAMAEAGAEIIDVGPESTRPGSCAVSTRVQIERAVPVIRAIRAENPTVPVSIDARLAPVAEAAIDAGANMINDVSALGDDPAMVEVAARTGVAVCLMHRRGISETMQADGGPAYEDVIAEILDFLRERIEFAISRGVLHEHVVVDPGIGFGKRVEHNLQILRDVDRFTSLGCPVLVGASRKGFIGKVLNIEKARNRDAASLACAAVSAMGGASIIRSHDVAPTVQVVRVCTAIKHAAAATT
jgi:dihydropteroate synthase